MKDFAPTKRVWGVVIPKNLAKGIDQMGKDGAFFRRQSDSASLSFERLERPNVSNGEVFSI